MDYERVLFLGENWLGSNARSCSESFRRLGCAVMDVDSQTFLPDVKRLFSRVLNRLLRHRLVREYNDHILRTAQQFNPDFVLAFKGNYVLPETLTELAKHGISLYNYYPDTSAFSHGKWIPMSLAKYDCVFYTKRFWHEDVSQRIELKSALYLPHGYDLALHRSVELTSQDRHEFACDISFIATYTAYKADILGKLVGLRPNLNLSIWGSGWLDKKVAVGLRKHIRGYPLLGESYIRAIQASRINLGIMSGRVEGSSQGDETTSRTYTIPASGGFMLHERNPEVLELYKENEEIACFESAGELAQQIDYFLANSEQRMKIAKAGHVRCVPAYSYDNRMAEILRYHRELHHFRTTAARGC